VRGAVGFAGYPGILPSVYPSIVRRFQPMYRVNAALPLIADGEGFNVLAGARLTGPEDQPAGVAGP